MVYKYTRCTGLTQVEIPSGVNSVGQQAFSGCTGLKSVKWNAEDCGKGITSDVFNNCPIENFEFGGERKVYS